MDSKHLFALALLGASLACASLESAANSGSNMAQKNLGHTNTATKAATLDEDKEVQDLERAAETGMDDAEEQLDADDE